MNAFSLVESNGQFAHLLKHTVFFRIKNSSVNETELWGKTLCLEAREDLVLRGPGVGTSSQLYPECYKPGRHSSPHSPCVGIGRSLEWVSQVCPILGPLCSQCHWTQDHYYRVRVEKQLRRGGGRTLVTSTHPSPNTKEQKGDKVITMVP